MSSSNPTNNSFWNLIQAVKNQPVPSVVQVADRKEAPTKVQGSGETASTKLKPSGGGSRPKGHISGSGGNKPKTKAKKGVDNTDSKAKPKGKSINLIEARLSEPDITQVERLYNVGDVQTKHIQNLSDLKQFMPSHLSGNIQNLISKMQGAYSEEEESVSDESEGESGGNVSFYKVKTLVEDELEGN